jgi:endonuclease-3 related protein
MDVMRGDVVLEVYKKLLEYYGPHNWWPGESKIEVLVGAVLIQNTNWSNVTKAIENLKNRGLLSFQQLHNASLEEIADCIRPSGYYNKKAKRLHNLLKMIADCYDADLEALCNDSVASANENLLSVKGVGQETADVILLYCGNHPVFVVDAYTHRVFSRHNLVPDECGYYELQEMFTCSLTPDPQLFNEYHALIVMVGKEFCKKKTPLCERCPLKGVEG